MDINPFLRYKKLKVRLTNSQLVFHRGITFWPKRFIPEWWGPSASKKLLCLPNMVFVTDLARPYGVELSVRFFHKSRLFGVVKCQYTALPRNLETVRIQYQRTK